MSALFYTRKSCRSGPMFSICTNRIRGELRHSDPEAFAVSCRPQGFVIFNKSTQNNYHIIVVNNNKLTSHNGGSVFYLSECSKEYFCHFYFFVLSYRQNTTISINGEWISVKLVNWLVLPRDQFSFVSLD